MYVIRNKHDSEAFWSTLDGWVSRENADEYPADQKTSLSLPQDGEWADRRHGLTFKIVRKFQDPNKEDEHIEDGLSFDEARAHCSDPSSSGPGWMDVFYEE